MSKWFYGVAITETSYVVEIEDGEKDPETAAREFIYEEACGEGDTEVSDVREILSEDDLDQEKRLADRVEPL